MDDGQAVTEQAVAVPESLRAFGRWQYEGEAGRRWLAELPGVVGQYCRRWGLLVDGRPMHGFQGMAVPVVRAGVPLVLKVGWPDGAVAAQAAALRAWNGAGMVLLVEADPSASVLLVERLDASVSLRDQPLREAVPLIGRLLRRLAVPAPIDLPTTWEAAATLCESLRDRWQQVGQPFSTRVLDMALYLAEEMAADRPPVMFDADLHYDHVLRGRRERWLAIDPKPMFGSIEHQAGQLLWTRFDEMATSGRLRWCLDALVDAADMDPERAHAWAVLRSIDYWVWGLRAGFTEDPVRCRHIVEELA